jgi:hypothetical protein
MTMLWKPGPDRVLITSLREGIPERRHFYTIEYVDPKRRRAEERIYCRTRGDRDHLIALLNATADLAQVFEEGD